MSRSLVWSLISFSLLFFPLLGRADFLGNPLGANARPVRPVQPVRPVTALSFSTALLTCARDLGVQPTAPQAGALRDVAIPAAASDQSGRRHVGLYYFSEAGPFFVDLTGVRVQPFFDIRFSIKNRVVQLHGSSFNANEPYFFRPEPARAPATQVNVLLANNRTAYTHFEVFLANRVKATYDEAFLQARRNNTALLNGFKGKTDRCVVGPNLGPYVDRLKRLVSAEIIHRALSQPHGPARTPVGRPVTGRFHEQFGVGEPTHE